MKVNLKKFITIIISIFFIISLIPIPTNYIAFAAQNNTTLKKAQSIDAGDYDVVFLTKPEDDAYDQFRWYSFTPQETGYYIFKLTNTFYDCSENDTYMEIYDNYSDAQNEDNYYYKDMEENRDCITINKKLNKDQVYYLHIYVSSELEIGKPYTMHLNVALHNNHSNKTYTEKATTSKNGKIYEKCIICGSTKTLQVIYQPKQFALSKTNYAYDGKSKTPTITVKDSKGNKLVQGTDYSVSYSSGRKNVGKYSAKVTFKGNYSGSKTLYFTIVPKATNISSLTAASKGFTVKWKKQATQTTGYQIQYATDSKFTKNCKTITVSKNSTTSKKISKLSGKKKYYVRVRTYKSLSGTKYYSSWCKTKTITTKK